MQSKVQAEARRSTTPDPIRGAWKLALACSAAVLLAACVDLTASETRTAPDPSAKADAPVAKEDRAYDGWNHNAVDVRVYSGTGRQVLR